MDKSGTSGVQANQKMLPELNFKWFSQATAGFNLSFRG